MTSWLRPFARKPNLAGSAVPGGTEAGGGAVEGDADGAAEASPEPPSSIEADGPADPGGSAVAGTDEFGDTSAVPQATTAIAIASAKPSGRAVRRRVAMVEVGTVTAPTSLRARSHPRCGRRRRARASRPR